MTDKQVLNICIQGFIQSNWDFLPKSTSNSLKRLSKAGFIQPKRDKELNCRVYTITPMGKVLLKRLNALKLVSLKQYQNFFEEVA